MSWFLVVSFLMAFLPKSYMHPSSCSCYVPCTYPDFLVLGWLNQEGWYEWGMQVTFLVRKHQRMRSFERILLKIHLREIWHGFDWTGSAQGPLWAW
jgi:hypothetical protein